MERLDPSAAKKMVPVLKGHPFKGIRRWVEQRYDASRPETVWVEKIDYELIRIPSGVFMMGSPESEEGRYSDEGPVHEVTVPSFEMGKYPVTNEQYGKFLEENPDATEPEYWADRRFNQPRQPVVGVSWEDARRFAAWAGLRLPSEAEWEYACRAGTRTRYYSGSTEEIP